MRRSTLITLFAIAILTAFAVWIAVPGSRIVLGRQAQVVQGLDLQGGLQVLLKAKPAKGQKVTDQAMNDVRQVIENRVNGLGVSEPLVQRQGSDQLVVEIPGIKNSDQAIETLKGTGLLEFIDTNGKFLAPGTMVNTTLGPASEATGSNNAAVTAQIKPEATQPVLVPATSTSQSKPGATSSATKSAAGAVNPRSTPSLKVTPVGTSTAAVGGQTTPGSSGSENGPVYQTVVTGNAIESASPAFDPNTGAPIVTFTLKGEGAQKFGEYTSSHVGQPLTIVLDKKVVSAPTIQSPITNGNGEITGVTQQEAKSLAIQLRYGSLPIAMEVVSSNSVGATLGQDSVDRSVIAGAIAIIAVVLFMILYYRLPGLLSAIALGVYGAIVFAAFKLIPVTLTLAGIAGFILSIGMAVDANVLIFSRMKEELRRGRTLLQAVDMGFRNAWPSIRDSNISTLITCVILIWFGSHYGASIIRGFAFTLGIGVLVSMFSAIVVTRTLLQVVVATPVVKNIWLWGVSRSDIPQRSTTTGRALGGSRAR